MSVEEFFQRLRSALEAAGVPYMLTGSHASAVHGSPRSTQDVDIVIAPTRAQLAALLLQLPTSKYYVSEEAALEAFSRRTQFNVIDLATGWKIDFLLRKDREFSLEEFRRRTRVETAGTQIDAATAEDTLLAKLEWAKMGSSDRQIEDAAGIVRIQGDDLDVEYVEHWVRELGVEEQWTQAKSRAESGS